jgi:hypothetical protein
VNQYKGGRNECETRRQKSFIAARSTANSGEDAAPMARLVTLVAADDSLLIGFPDDCDEVLISHR